MQATYWQPGEVIDYKNTGATKILNGTVITIGDKIGIAGCDINPDAVGSLYVEGVFRFTKKTAATVLTIGTNVLLDVTGIDDTTGDPCGWVVETSVTGQTDVLVKINA